MSDKCAVPNCQQTPYLTYYGKGICRKCWDKHCDDKSRFNLKMKLKIPPDPEYAAATAFLLGGDIHSIASQQ